MKTIEKRAGEIAVIEGRPSATKEDRAQARAELNGSTLPPAGIDDASTSESLSRDPAIPRRSAGTRSPNYEGPDEEKATERLVTEGVEEAQHDQMFAARRKKAL